MAQIPKGDIMIELVAVHEPKAKLKDGGKSINDLLNPLIEPNKLPPSSYVENGIYYRLIGYVETSKGYLIGKYEPVFEKHQAPQPPPPKPHWFERFLRW